MAVWNNFQIKTAAIGARTSIVQFPRDPIAPTLAISVGAWYLWRMKNPEWVVEIYEKVEHWTFEVRIRAATSAEARQLAANYYGRGYSIRGVYRGAE